MSLKVILSKFLPYLSGANELIMLQQGKSEGFVSCNQPSNLTQTGFKLSIFPHRWTWKFHGWPWKAIEHLFYTTWSFVHHFVAISEFTLELQSRNTQFGSKLAIYQRRRFCNIWSNSRHNLVHILQPTMETQRSWSWMIDSPPFGPPIPEICLFQNLTLKIQGYVHGWGQSSGSQGWPSIQMMCFLFHINLTKHSKVCVSFPLPSDSASGLDLIAQSTGKTPVKS